MTKTEMKIPNWGAQKEAALQERLKIVNLISVKLCALKLVTRRKARKHGFPDSL